MTNKVVVEKLMDGPRDAILHVYLESDGVAGELERAVILDPHAAFDPEVEKVTITRIWSSLAVFDALLEFNALEPVAVWVVSPENGSEVCFKHCGGLKDRSTVESDGKLMITTNGFSPVGSKGVLIIHVRKN